MENKDNNTSILAGSRIGQYRIIRQIGSGGSGDVYLCRHIVLDKSYAIKILDIPPGEQGKEMQGRVLREARIARSIRHRNLVSVIDANVKGDGNTAWIVMEYVDGETLEELLAESALPESAALYVCRCVALVLAEAEKHNIVHRDIKPANILIDRAGNVKVTDLGIAKTDKASVRYDEPVTREEKLLGTPDYASPEQLRDSSSVDIRADIYSLGATLYHMLSGRKPFEADGVFNLMALVLESEPPEIPDITPATAELLKKMMAKDPEQRPADARTLLDELRKVSRANARQTSEIRKFLAGGARRIFSDENARLLTVLRNIFIIFCAIASGVMISLHAIHEYGNSKDISSIGKHLVSIFEKNQPAKLRRLYESGNAESIIKAIAESGNTDFLHLAIKSVPELVSFPQYATLWMDNLSDKKSRDMLKALLKYNFPVNAVKAPDRSPAIFRKELMYDDELLRLLLEHKLEAAVLDSDGRTALLRMARSPKASVKCARLMLMAGVPINARDKNSQNAFMVAANAGNTRLMRFLYNAKINLTDEDISKIPDVYNIKHELISKKAAAAQSKAKVQKKQDVPVIEAKEQKTAAVPAVQVEKKTSEKSEVPEVKKVSSSYIAAVKKDLQHTEFLLKKRQKAAGAYDVAESSKMRRKIEVYLQTNPSGRLMLEGEKEFVESVITALQSGRINPDIRTGNENTHLLESAANGYIFPRKRLFRALLDAGADPDSVPLPADAELSRMLVLYGRTKFASNELIKLLSVPDPDWETAGKMVLRGADVTARNRRRKENAFHRAAALGNIDFLTLLLNSGKAGADAVDADGFTPYQLAVVCGKKEAAKLLAAYNYKQDTTAEMRSSGNLFNAVKNNDSGKTAYYLALGVIPYQVNGMYQNVLQCAVESNALDAALVLLDNGVSPNRYTGISPLEIALKNKNEEMFILLVSHKGDLQTKVKDRFGRNSLLFTAVFRYMKDDPEKLFRCLRTMLEHNWKWQKTTPDGDTPLTWMEKWNEGNQKIKELFVK